MPLHPAAATVGDISHPQDRHLVPHRRSMGASDEDRLGQVYLPFSCDADRCVHSYFTIVFVFVHNYDMKSLQRASLWDC